MTCTAKVTPEIIDCNPLLRLGFVGVRILNDAEKKWLNERLIEIWDLSRKVVPNCYLRLTSGLAHGADRVAVNSFLYWRKKEVHEFLAIYPCDPEEFRNFSGIHDKNDFDNQREAILADNRGAELVLDGSLPRGGTENTNEETREGRVRAAAYTYQSEVLIRQSEFLIAVLDRCKEGKIGGTRGTILNALVLGTPVLILDPSTRSCFLLRYPDELRQEYEPVSPTSWKDDWAKVLRHKTPTLPTTPEQAGQVNSIEEIYKKDSSNSHPFASRWEAFYSAFRNYATRNQKLPESKVQKTTFATPVLLSLSTVRILILALWGFCFPNRQRDATNRNDTLVVELWRGKISDHQKTAMGAYRGIFLVNYFLGLVAIMFALCSFGILAWTGLKPGIMCILVLLVLTVLKLWVVCQITKNTNEAESMDYNSFAVSSRYIAERLRIMPVILLTGASRVDLLHESPRQGKPHEITKNLCRRIPLSDCAIRHNSKTALTALRELIGNQYNHHRNTHITMQAMHQILEHAVKLAGKAIIYIVIVDILLLASKLILKCSVLKNYLSLEILATTGFWLGIAGLLAVALTALFPAIMATLNAILFQSQAEQLAEHHGAMASALEKLDDEAGQLEKDLNDHNRFETTGSHAVLALTERTANLMAEEVAEWATMYRQGVKEP